MTTNMYQKNILSNLNQVLANLSIGDTKHDFGYQKTLLESISFKNAYNSGLPEGYNKIDDEEECVSNIIKSYTKENDKLEITDGKYVPIESANPNLEKNKTTVHNINTINDYSYTVNYTVVKGKGEKEIDSNTFYKNLDLENDTDIAIVVDAASISLIDILSSGNIKLKGKRPNIYYIYGPEVVNDPATKKHPSSKEFIKETGVNFIPCVPINPASFVYNYSFTKNPDENTLYLEQFFTDYEFNLSEINTNSQYKAENYTTNLNIISNKNGKDNFNNVLIDSKSKNDINFLSVILQKLLGALGISQNKFLMSSSLQQKRSGDWLQVLLCAALRDKSRAFKLYPNGKQNLTRDIQRVFFVTHDRIALAFALLNGIDCLFTHHHSKTHLHSAFIYKLNDPIKQKQNIIDLSNTIKNEYENLKISINNIENKISDYQDKYFNVNVKNYIDLLDNKLDNDFSEINKIKEGENKFDVNLNFNKNIKEIFTQSLVIINSKQNFPDFTNLLEEFKELSDNTFDELDKLINLDNSNENALSEDEPNISSKIIENYNEINEKINNTNKLIDQSIKNSKNFENNLNNFKKSSIYNSANTWSWDTSSITRRELPLLTNINEPKNYGADRNIFLYNLNNLDNTTKQKIAYLFKTYYDYIIEKSEIIVPSNINDYFIANEISKSGQINNLKFGDVQFTKFKAVSVSFCIENLLVFGSNGINLPEVKLTAETIQKTMDEYLLKPSPFTSLINDYTIIKEDVTYDLNIVNKKVDIGLNFFRQIIRKQIGGDDTRDNLNYNNTFLFSNKQVIVPLLNYILLSNAWYYSLYNCLESIIENDNSTNKELQKIYISLQDIERNNNLSKLKINILDNNDLLKNSQICFHPLLPIYIITQSYLKSIYNETISTSLDYDIIIPYFDLLKKIKTNLMDVYSNSNSNIDKAKAYVIGFGLKNLFFILNNTLDNYYDCLDVLKIDDEKYSKVSSYTNALVTDIIGKNNFTEKDIDIGLIYLKSDLFKKFSQSLDINSIFNNETKPENININNFKKEVYNFSIEIGNQIISDRTIIEYIDDTKIDINNDDLNDTTMSIINKESTTGKRLLTDENNINSNLKQQKKYASEPWQSETHLNNKYLNPHGVYSYGGNKTVKRKNKKQMKTIRKNKTSFKKTIKNNKNKLRRKTIRN
jgi:hypothetical protein